MGLRGLRDYLLAWRIARVEDRQIVNSPPQPVIIVGANDGADAVPSIVNAAGEVTEASGAAVLANAVGINASVFRAKAGLPLVYRADGSIGSASVETPWFPAIPVAIASDGAGAVAAAVEVIAAIALHRIDAVFTVQVSVSGLHQLDFIENTAAAAVTTPDYNTAPPDVFLVAGFPYTFRLMNVVANRNLGSICVKMCENMLYKCGLIRKKTSLR